MEIRIGYILTAYGDQPRRGWWARKGSIFVDPYAISSQIKLGIAALAANWFLR